MSRKYEADKAELESTAAAAADSHALRMRLEISTIRQRWAVDNISTVLARFKRGQQAAALRVISMAAVKDRLLASISRAQEQCNAQRLRRAAYQIVTVVLALRYAQKAGCLRGWGVNKMRADHDHSQQMNVATMQA